MTTVSVRSRCVRPAAHPSRLDNGRLGTLQPVCSAPDRPAPINSLTVDMEDYFHCEVFARTIRPRRWHTCSDRLALTIPSMLEMLAGCNVRATFFVLGWVARRYPRLVRQVADAGHEVASHGYWHQHLSRMTPTGLRQDLQASRRALEDIVAAPVIGYRAPTFSLTRRTAWAAELVVEQGFAYDSSVFPIYHDRYGVPEAPGEPWWLETKSGRLLELPPLTFGSSRLKLPAAGGGYLRLLPACLVRGAIRWANARGRPAVLYVHPWELDPLQPRPPVGWLARRRHYGGLSRMRSRLTCLLAAYHFRPMAELAAQQWPICRRRGRL
ncbi:MAG TPA: XrtA system polysaccharide deacetylase [Phycisphaerae bacterium]|nr:XrtA system polysaccharide deacetylase [Phycisphaerae bacterium]